MNYDATQRSPLAMRPLVVSPLPKPQPLSDVPGARYVEELLTVAGEERLIAFIDENPWLAEFKRRRMWFGYSYDVAARRLPEYLGPLPPILKELGAALVGGGLMRELPDQAIAQEYLSGQSIAAHTDASVFGPDVVSISLVARCIIVFDHPGLGVK